jgi:alanine-glyoxylate transaminase/serine-glyoxylate transaminase/serine-pyruvate transaminase
MKISAPKFNSLSHVLPEKPTLLMGAGPVPIPREVARANSIVINHLGATMNTIVDGIRSMGQYVFQTQSEKIFGISGPASAGLEMAVSSLLWPGRKVLVLNLGTFSARFAEFARGVGAEVKEIFPAPLSGFTVEQVETEFKNEHFDVLTIVQGETSCGIKNVELEGIVKLAREYDTWTIVDAVSTLTTMPLPMDEWGIDVIVTGGQKGLSSVAGVSLIAFSERVFDFISSREVRMPHWCLDPRRAYRFWVKHEYHYTAPVSGVLALYEALRLICQETLEKRYERHLFYSSTLQHCLEVMGLNLYAPKECRLNSVVAIKNPSGVNTKELLSYMAQTYRVELSGAFGLDIFRVGQMGEQCRTENVRRTLEAIGYSYAEFGVKLNLRDALEEFDKYACPVAMLKCV